MCPAIFRLLCHTLCCYTDQVIFAHPCKRPCDLRYARDTGVPLTTFDTESELTKIAGAYPGIQLVLRIRCDDPEVCVWLCG